jgi:hypothetical protein
MHWSLIVAVMALLSSHQDQPQVRAVLEAAGFPVPADLRYRVLADGIILFDGNTVRVPDTRQQTLHAFDPAAKRSTEVFPGSFDSRYGPLVMTRIADLLARVGEADRESLVAKKIAAGFDRSITSWRVHPTGRTVALAAHYYRDQLLNSDVEMSDDYGRSEPIDAAEFEFFAVAVCSRTGADAWTCNEEALTAVAKQHNVTLPNDRAGRAAAAEKLLDVVLREQ